MIGLYFVISTRNWRRWKHIWKGSLTCWFVYFAWHYWSDRTVRTSFFVVKIVVNAQTYLILKWRADFSRSQQLILRFSDTAAERNLIGPNISCHIAVSQSTCTRFPALYAESWCGWFTQFLAFAVFCQRNNCVLVFTTFRWKSLLRSLLFRSSI